MAVFALSRETFETAVAFIRQLSGERIGFSKLTEPVLERLWDYEDFYALSMADRTRELRIILIAMYGADLVESIELASADGEDYEYYKSVGGQASSTNLDSAYSEYLRIVGLPAWVDAETSLAPEAAGEFLAVDHVSEVENAAIQKIFYATDRALSSKGWFGPSCADGPQVMTYGTCEVSIPSDHVKGVLERPRWWRFEFRENVADHVAILDVRRRDEANFLADVRGATREDEGRDSTALVFVHGFRTTFEQAVLRTAQFAFDLEFKGPALAYSWPSAGLLKSYVADATSAQRTIPHFREFLLLLYQAGVRAVHVIAHSMGGQVAVSGATALAGVPNAPAVEMFVLAAPDIDRGVFLQLADSITAVAKKVTLYASSKDLALKVSRSINGGSRAGDSTDMIIHGGIDSIDATAVDTDVSGHGYFADNRTLLSDINSLIAGKPLPRFGVKQVVAPSGLFWRFVP